MCVNYCTSPAAGSKQASSVRESETARGETRRTRREEEEEDGEE